MEQIYSIIMFIIAGILFVYSILLIRTGNARLLPYHRQMGKPVPKRRVRRIGESLAFVGYAPLLSGIMGLIIPFAGQPLPSLIVLAVVLAAAIVLRLRIRKADQLKLQKARAAARRRQNP